MVTLPLWMAVLVGALAAWAAYDKLLMPALRWFLAGRTNVVLEEVSTRLRIGVRTMPGTPEGVSVRLGGINAPTDKFVQAVLLSAMPALHAPATLIVPAGWFRPKRLVELRRGSDSAVLLTAALERGSNFDRCTFEPA